MREKIRTIRPEPLYDIGNVFMTAREYRNFLISCGVFGGLIIFGVALLIKCLLKV